MSNRNNVVLEKHLDSLAAAISAEISTIGSGSGGGSGTSYSDFTGATSIAGGVHGLVPAPAVGDQMHFLRGDGVWASVGRDPCTLTLSESSGTVGKDGTITFTVTTPSDGAISVASSDTSIATATVSGNTVTVTGVEYGNATITVSQAPGFDYASPPAVNYSVSVQPAIGATLNTTAWDVISEISQAGLGDTYWDIGDCKEITLNGKVGDFLTLENEKLCVFILHFNYAMNGTAENNIIFGGFKTALTSGKDVALCDSKCGSGITDGTICFTQNHWGNVNYGGWKGTDLRYDILGATSTAPSEYNQLKTTANVGYNATAATLTNPKANTLLAALPSDFRNALRLWSRWVDAKGNSSNVEENIEETIDAVTLLTEWEAHGAQSYANNYEKNHQTQMDYYKNGNSKIKYNHTSISSAVWWWCSSPVCNANNYFCIVTADGSAYAGNAFYAGGVSPAFKV